MRNRRAERESLPPHWRKVHGAIWLIGLAILYMTRSFWPGILILIALSGLAQAAMLAYIKRNEETKAIATAREVHLPPTCPNCGSPLNASEVRWTGPRTARCPYCGSTIKAIESPTENAVEQRERKPTERAAADTRDIP